MKLGKRSRRKKNPDMRSSGNLNFEFRYDQDNIKECFVERLVMTLNAAEITHE